MGGVVMARGRGVGWVVKEERKKKIHHRDTETRRSKAREKKGGGTRFAFPPYGGQIGSG
jgi:L-ascorbate metabolism protein UlaG (beta-lactamase superfamily)